MTAAAQRQALALLQQVGERVETAEGDWQAGDALAAVRALVQARRLCGQATAALVGYCLRAAWGDVRQRGSAADLAAFFQMVEFAWDALCPACREQAAAGFAETQSDGQLTGPPCRRP